MRNPNDIKKLIFGLYVLGPGMFTSFSTNSDWYYLFFILGLTHNDSHYVSSEKSSKRIVPPCELRGQTNNLFTVGSTVLPSERHNDQKHCTVGLSYHQQSHCGQFAVGFKRILVHHLGKNWNIEPSIWWIDIIFCADIHGGWAMNPTAFANFGLSKIYKLLESSLTWFGQWFMTKYLQI